MDEKDEELRKKQMESQETEQNITKTRIDHDNVRRSCNFNDHENKLLREQL